MATVQFNVRFRGRIQGVGFRYTTKQIAEEFKITGYVVNLADGDVACVACGESETVAKFVDKVQEVMERFVREVDIQEQPATDQYIGFTINR